MTDAPAPAPRPCPTCGTPIPPDAPAGACPRCLMALGFQTGPGGTDLDVVPAEVERRFPGYAILGTLGRGGMGVVFRARQTALDREVALKVLPAAPGRGPEFAERFRREAHALARLQHPGIVQVFDSEVSNDGWCALAMELVDGTNLRRVLADRRIAPKEALAIVPQICDALQYAHDQGVVHRDIKPENVLLGKDGRVKIADFGLAKLAGSAGGGAGEAGGAGLTRSGHVMGTPHYMAPEQIEHPADVDHRADIYSLGVVFYEMLTGELPLGRFPPPSRSADVDARIDAIVLRTLEKEREARYQRAADVKTEVGAAGTPDGATAARPASPATQRGSAVPSVRMILAVGALLFAALSLWFALRRDGGVAIALAAASVALSLIRRYAFPRGPETAPATTASAAPAPAAPQGPPSRLSRLAVLTAFAPLAVALAALAAWGANSGSTPAKKLMYMGLWTGPLAVVASIVSLVAWTRVRRSGGRLHGALFAAIGLLGSLLATATISVLHVSDLRDDDAKNGRRTYHFDERSPDGTSLDAAAAVDWRVDAVRGLVDRYVRLDPADREGALSLYADRDRKPLATLPDAVRDARADAGLIGLPLATERWIGASPHLFRIVWMSFDGDAATVSVESEGVLVTAGVLCTTDLETGNVRWGFTAKPLVRQGGTVRPPLQAKPKPMWTPSDDPSVAALEAEITRRRAFIDTLIHVRGFAEDHPDVVADRKTLALLEERRDALLASKLGAAAPNAVDVAVLAALEVEIIKAQDRLDELTTVLNYGESHPDVGAARRALARLEARRAELTSKPAGASAPDGWPAPK